MAPTNESITSDDLEVPPQRKKLQLKPRSATSNDTENSKGLSSKGNPFGAAVPREEVLTKRGVDPNEFNSRIERKAEVPHYTIEQNDEIEKIRAELTQIQLDRREANEMELPEETFRLDEESKKKELNEVMEKFSKLNEVGKREEVKKKKFENDKSKTPTTSSFGKSESSYPARNSGKAESSYPARNSSKAESSYPARNSGKSESSFPARNSGKSESFPARNSGKSESFPARNSGKSEAFPARNSGKSESFPVRNPGPPPVNNSRAGAPW